MSTNPAAATAAADAGPAAAAGAPVAGGAATSVHVRMYRGLLASATAPDNGYTGMLGDCFLIRLEGDGKKSHILIDCGLLLGSPDQANRAVAIAEHIVDACDGLLDLVVVTHEHWDHISGFSQAEKVFFDNPKLKIGEVWMAWTEDPDDVDAEALRAKFDKSGQAFAMIADRLSTQPPIPGLDPKRALDGLQGFLGEPGRVADAPAGAEPVPATAADGAEQVAGQVPDDAPSAKVAGPTGKSSGALAGRDILARLKAAAPTKYLAPVQADRKTTAGNIRQTPGEVSLRTTVMGPPRDWKRLSKDKPSSGAGKQETYLDTPSLGQALLGFAGGASALATTDSPFAPQYCRRPLAPFTATTGPAAGVQPAGDAAQGPPDDVQSRWLIERYFQPRFGEHWDHPASADPASRADAVAKRQGIADRRRIDGEWLASAGALAMKLDSDTNNTSLVLAFDLPDGTVMLFAADAQVGNWLSWRDQTYGEGEAAIDATKILERVRFYKVGHHGSHNATLDEQGLALMKHADLVAAIPTDEALGRKQGRGGWLMPNPRVNTALVEKTKGRILRNDRRFKDPVRRNDDLAGVDLTFFDSITEDDMFLEFQVLPQIKP